MAVSNAENRLVLATGNKSELSVGYCTLYGDTVGGIAVHRRRLQARRLRARAPREPHPRAHPVAHDRQAAERRARAGSEATSDDLPAVRHPRRRARAGHRRRARRVPNRLRPQAPRARPWPASCAASTATNTSAANRRWCCASRRRPSGAEGSCRSSIATSCRNRPQTSAWIRRASKARWIRPPNPLPTAPVRPPPRSRNAPQARASPSTRATTRHASGKRIRRRAAAAESSAARAQLRASPSISAPHATSARCPPPLGPPRAIRRSPPGAGSALPAAASSFRQARPRPPSHTPPAPHAALPESRTRPSAPHPSSRTRSRSCRSDGRTPLCHPHRG